MIHGIYHFRELCGSFTANRLFIISSKWYVKPAPPTVLEAYILISTKATFEMTLQPLPFQPHPQSPTAQLSSNNSSKADTTHYHVYLCAAKNKDMKELILRNAQCRNWENWLKEEENFIWFASRIRKHWAIKQFIWGIKWKERKELCSAFGSHLMPTGSLKPWEQLMVFHQPELLRL